MPFGWEAWKAQLTEGTSDIGSTCVIASAASKCRIPLNIAPGPRGGTVLQEKPMSEPSRKEIENRAYQLWEENGRPPGREDEFWRLAEQELRNQDKSSPLRTPDTL